MIQFLILSVRFNITGTSIVLDYDFKMNLNI
jgi:hypothetical protein